MGPGPTSSATDRTALVHIERGAGVVWKVVFESEAVPGTLAAFAGILSITGLDIVTANVALSDGGSRVIDTFEVIPVTCTGFSADRADELAAQATDALSGRINLADLVRERSVSRGRGHLGGAVGVEVHMDTDSAITTGIRIRANDRPGLLFDITSVLTRHGLRTRALAALTVGGVARDIFRVVDGAGSPPQDQGVLDALRVDLVRVCG